MTLDGSKKPGLYARLYLILPSIGFVYRDRLGWPAFLLADARVGEIPTRLRPS